MRVLVSDAGTPAALAVVRSLGRAGHRVSVLASSRDGAAAASRYAAAAVPVPDPVREPEAFSAALVRTLTDCGRDVFLPVTDTAMLLADGVREAIPGRVRLAMPGRAALRTLLDKTAVLARAEALSIPVLRRRVGPAIPDAPLPAVLKPVRSRVVAHRAVHAATASVHAGRDGLLRAAKGLERRGLGAYAEPWIPGTGHGIFLLRHEGRILARFAHRRIREASPRGGPSAAAESVEAHPDLVRWAEDLAADLDVSGPFMAEFRGQGDDFVLLEVNARYWGSLSLALDAGVDFPRLHLTALAGRPVEGPGRWRTGISRRHLAFDLRRVADAFRGRPAGLAIPWPDPVGAVLDLLSGPWRGLIHAAKDPAPSRSFLLSLLRRGRRHG